MEQLTYQNTIPVKYHVDVFVAGGEPAGMAAAVSAAKTGASVYVAERAGAMGGMSTAGLVPAFSQYSDGIHNLVGGVGTEILERLREMGGTGDEGGFSIRPEVLKRLYDQMLLENGVQFTFHTALVDVQQQEGHVCYAILHGKSGLFAVQADAFVDCTGDGDLAVLAGAQYEKGDENGKMMPGALCSHWHGIDWTVADRDPTQRRMLEQAFADGVFSVQDLSLPGIWKTGETTGGGNVGRCFGVDGTDEVSVTSAYVEMRRRLVE